MSAGKTRLPRRKPINYSIMREAPFYDGMLTADHKDVVREMRGLYELILTAHYVRNLYVASVWGWAGGKTKSANVEMVTPEGFIVLSIRATETTNDLGETSGAYNIGSTPGFPDSVQAPFKAFRTDKLSAAVSFIAHGIRRRASWDDPFDYYVSHDTQVDSLRKIETPTARIEAVLSDIAYRLTRHYELSTQHINLDSDCTTWAARCASGRASMLDAPHAIRSKIETAAEEYHNACAKIEDTLSRVRDGLCRKKLMIAHGMYLGDPEKINRSASKGPGNDQPLIIATADFTPMYEALVNHVTNGTPSSDFTIQFDSKPRLYKSFNSLPEEMKAQIAPKMIPINLRKGVGPSEWADKIFPPLNMCCEYLEEIESLIYTRDNPAVNWYVVNY